MNNGILLASGGLDSTTMFYWLENQDINVSPLFINFGQHCAKKELKTLKSVLPQESLSEIIELDISDIYKFSLSASL
ncbi:MAG: 7-cyano-7-deazaguanine synthase [Balneolaceae bacterium]